MKASDCTYTAIRRKTTALTCEFSPEELIGNDPLGKDEYILNLVNERYLHLGSDPVRRLGLSASDLQRSGLAYVLSTWDKHSLKIYDEEVFPINFMRLQELPPRQVEDYLFTCNFLVADRNGRLRNIEQHSRFIRLSEDGLPLVIRGRLVDITHRNDVRLIHTIRNDKALEDPVRYTHLLNGEKLTPLEKSVHQLVCDGYSSDTIRAMLNLKGKQTVNNVCRSIKAKLNGTKSTAWWKYYNE